ncbi:hypothetical protein MTO96_013580 [Rhipicephalus appendiculatus]
MTWQSYTEDGVARRQADQVRKRFIRQRCKQRNIDSGRSISRRSTANDQRVAASLRFIPFSVGPCGSVCPLISPPTRRVNLERPSDGRGAHQLGPSRNR